MAAFYGEPSQQEITSEGNFPQMYGTRQWLWEETGNRIARPLSNFSIFADVFARSSRMSQPTKPLVVGRLKVKG